MTETASSLLLLIPAYNEEDRIEPVLRDFAQFFRREHAGGFKLVVVLNGCTDDTLGVVKRVAAEFPEISHLNFPGRIGKGGALIEGLKLAPLADIVGYVDADGATSPSSVLKLLRLCDQADCVVGSRWLPGSLLHRSQTRLRRFASRVFHVIVQALFWMNIKDTQCPAKLVHREAIEKIHSALTIADMAFDINLLYALKRAGFKVIEVPTEWTDMLGSKVVIGKTSLTMLLSVIRLRLVYSPFYRWLRPLRPLEGWLYRKLGAPPPRPTRSGESQLPGSVTRSDQNA